MVMMLLFHQQQREYWFNRKKKTTFIQTDECMVNTKPQLTFIVSFGFCSAQYSGFEIEITFFNAKGELLCLLELLSAQKVLGKVTYNILMIISSSFKLEGTYNISGL